MELFSIYQCNKELFMKATMKDVFYHALLARAAYADLNKVN